MRPSAGQHFLDEWDEEHLLYPFRDSLLLQLPLCLGHVVNLLYRLEVLSEHEMEMIKVETDSKKQVMDLLVAMKARCWKDCVVFGRLLCQIEGIQDIGQNILWKAGK